MRTVRTRARGGLVDSPRGETTEDEVCARVRPLRGGCSLWPSARWRGEGGVARIVWLDSGVGERGRERRAERESART